MAATQIRGDVDIKAGTIKNAQIHAAAGIEYSKLAALTAGSIPFAGAGGFLTQDNANLFWDDTNNRLGVGVASNFYGKLTVETDNAAVNSFEFGGAIVVRTTTAFGANIGPHIRFSGRNTASAPTSGDPYAFATIAGRKENATSGNFAGYLQFATTDAGSTIVERMRIDSVGFVGIGIVPTCVLDIARTAEDLIVRSITTTSGISRVDVRGYGTTTTLPGNMHLSGAHIVLVNKNTTDGNYTAIFNQSNGGAQRTAICFVNDVHSTEASSIAFLTHNGSALAERVRIDTTGRLGVGTSSPTAVVHLKAGTATANTGPLKFTAGTLLSSVELGSMEFVDDGTTGHLYITLNIASVLTRVQIV